MNPRWRGGARPGSTPPPAGEPAPAPGRPGLDPRDFARHAIERPPPAPGGGSTGAMIALQLVRSAFSLAFGTLRLIFRWLMR